MKGRVVENIIYLKTQRGVEYIAGDCERIEEHPARGDGDKWFYNVYDKSEGVIIRIFDPLEVHLEWPEEEQCPEA
jgi:hypothetical protein